MTVLSAKKVEMNPWEENDWWNCDCYMYVSNEGFLARGFQNKCIAQKKVSRSPSKGSILVWECDSLLYKTNYHQREPWLLRPFPDRLHRRSPKFIQSAHLKFIPSLSASYLRNERPQPRALFCKQRRSFNQTMAAAGSAGWKKEKEKHVKYIAHRRYSQRWF